MLQVPHLAFKLYPSAATFVAHQGLSFVDWAEFIVHALCSFPTYMKGKMHFLPESGPDIVMQVSAKKDANMSKHFRTTWPYSIKTETGKQT